MQCRFKVKKILKSNAGFSLMELLAVVVIITLLAVVLIPGYLHFIANAKKDGTIVTAQTIYLAAQMKATEFKGTETADKPYRIPGANDLRDLVGSDNLYEGVTYITITDENRDGRIDKVDLVKNDINVIIEPGNKVTVDGKERTTYKNEKLK